MGKALRITGIVLLSLAMVLVTVALLLPYLISTDFARDRLVRTVEQRTGKVLSIAGATRFRLFPGVSLVANEVSLANNRTDAAAEQLVYARSIEAKLAFIPLLQGVVEFTEVTAEEPRFYYRTDATGASNWQRPKVTQPVARGTKVPLKAILRSIGVDRVLLKDARVRYVRSNGSEELFSFDSIAVEQAQFRGGDPDQPVKLTSDFHWREQAFHTAGSLARFADLVAGKPVQLDLALQSGLGNGRYAGRIEPGSKPRVDGMLTAETASLRRLLTLFGVQLPGDNGAGAAKLETVLKGDSERIEFATRQLRIDALAAEAKGSLALGGARPRMDADIVADRIDLAPYVAQSAAMASMGEGQVNVATTKAPVDIRLGGLKAMDGRFSLRFQRLDVPPLQLEAGDATATLQNGVAEVDIRQVAGYGGNGQGKMRLDGQTSVPTLAGRLSLKDMQAETLLRAFAASDKLTGAGRVDLDLDLLTSGATSEAALAGLQGTARLAVRDGRIDSEQITEVRLVAEGDLDQPVKLAADFAWRQQPLHVTGTLQRLNDLLAGKPSEASFALESDIARGSFAGKLQRQAGAKPHFDGTLKADMPALRRLANLLGAEITVPRGLATGSLEAAVKGDPGRIEFATRQLQVDALGLTAKGSLIPAANGSRTRLDADVTTGRVNLADYFAAPPVATGGPTAAAAQAKAPFAINLAALKAFDGRLGVKFQQLDYPPLVLTKGDAVAKLDNGLADIDIRDVTAYAGKAVGTLHLDGRAATPALAGKLQLKDFQLQPLLRDFAQFDKLTGTGLVDIDLNAAGKKSDAALATLKGMARFELKNGVYHGIDIDHFAGVKPENLPSGFGNPFTSAPDQPLKALTAYKTASARFDFRDGVGKNDDFAATGNNFRIKAAGSVNLVDKSLVYRVAPTLFTNSWNLTVPVRLSGPWNKLKKEFDVFAFLGGSSTTATRALPTPTVTTAKPKPVAVAEKPSSDTLVSRGLKSDTEISTYLSGGKVKVNGAAAPATP